MRQGDPEHDPRCPTCRRFRAAAERYLQRHEPFIKLYVSRLGARHIPAEDLYQHCRVGCYRALCAFDPQEAGRFLSYARYWMWCETGKAIHGAESLVPVPQSIKKMQRELHKMPKEIEDAEIAAALGCKVREVQALRHLHLGHEHREVDERARSQRRTFDELRETQEARWEEIRRAEALHSALRTLTPIQRQILWATHQVGEAQPGAVLPQTEEGKRALLHRAKLLLRRALEHLTQEGPGEPRERTAQLDQSAPHVPALLAPGALAGAPRVPARVLVRLALRRWR